MTLPTNDRNSKRVDQRVDLRVRRLVQAAESFVYAIGAELTDWQQASLPTDFARLVDTLGIGRAKVDRLMAAARSHAHPVSELRPSAWWILFRRMEPVPMLPGEVDPIIDEAVAHAEPPAYRHRVDLLSADGLAYLLCSLHEPEALSPSAIAVLASWLEDGGGREEAVTTLRSWRTRFDRPSDSRQSEPGDATDDGTRDAQEAS